MSDLWSRIVVGIVGLPLVFGLLWVGGWYLCALLVAAALVSLHELYTMARPLRPLVLAGYGGATLAVVGARWGGVAWLLAGFLAVFVLAFVLNGIAETRAPTTVAISVTVFGAAWIGLGLGHLMLLRQIPEHAQLAVFAVVLTVFAADTAAYGVGRLVGRHKLAPVLSPGKTWEGFVAGAVAGIFVSFVALYQDKKDFLTVWQAIVLGVVVVLAAVVGDVFESAIKRDLEVKDSGRILGGHGGMLDRLDAILFAAPAAYYLIAAFHYA
jgi:phosphatidate cytidylyltransferase